jgi:ribosome-associated toxin RatA of RatAB toxin-antitoxin module
MYSFEASITIKRPAPKVYQAIKNMEDFPNFIRDVKNLKIIKRIDENKFISLWEIEIDGAPLRWKEEDSFDDENLQLKFNMLEGDYSKYQGSWQINGDGKITKLAIEASFDWGIPVLEKYVKKAFESRARRSMRGMLRSIKKRVEAQNV